MGVEHGETLHPNNSNKAVGDSFTGGQPLSEHLCTSARLFVNVGTGFVTIFHILLAYHDCQSPLCAHVNRCKPDNPEVAPMLERSRRDNVVSSNSRTPIKTAAAARSRLRLDSLCRIIWADATPRSGRLSECFESCRQVHPRRKVSAERRNDWL